jgi:HlyD family secretion protein
MSDMVSLNDRLRQLIAEQNSLLQSREQRASQHKARGLAQSIELESTTHELADLREQLPKLQAIAEKSADQERAYKLVYESGGTSRLDYFSAQKTRERDEHAVLVAKSQIDSKAHAVQMLKAAQIELRAQASADLSRMSAEIKNVSAQLAAVQLQIRECEVRYKVADAAHASAMHKARDYLETKKVQIARTLDKISQIRSAIQVAQRALDQVLLRAPIAGTVTNVTHKGKGDAAARGEALLTVVPTGTPLVIQAYVNQRDIGFVRNGQTAKLKFDAFPFQDFGMVRGSVLQIEQHPREVSGRGSEYRVTIAPERTWIEARGNKITFVSGMTVTAEIVTRKRAVLDYLLDPLRKLKETRWS